MFTNTIDKKKFVTDNNGNQLVDLAASIFSKSAAGLNNYQTVKLDSHYQMRADKVAFAEYGTDEYTEYTKKLNEIVIKKDAKDIRKELKRKTTRTKKMTQ